MINEAMIQKEQENTKVAPNHNPNTNPDPNQS